MEHFLELKCWPSAKKLIFISHFQDHGFKSCLKNYDTLTFIFALLTNSFWLSSNAPEVSAISSNRLLMEGVPYVNEPVMISSDRTDWLRL